MSDQIQNQYLPDVVSPPGETLLELLVSRRMSQAELADRTGRPKKTINEIVKGKAAITAETALQFERVLGVPASFWTSREQGYRESLARAKEALDLESQAGWLDEIPYKALIRLGWVQDRRDKSGQIEELLRFFAVASPSSWGGFWRNTASVAFRHSPSYSSEPGAVAAWLRRGEIEAEGQSCAAFDKESFKSVLMQARSLSREMPRDLPSVLKELCNSVGVALAFVPEIPGSRIWGAARWMNNECALIQLSLRYKTDDHFWFTFFHEAAHLVLHSRREFFLDEEAENLDLSEKEAEANEFARNWLIPVFQYRQFCRRGAFNCTAVERFAHEIGVGPGVVVGRLQFDGHLDRKFCHQLKREVSWILDRG
jgi:HTH-type transcriptional regulator / antitoxin HigA